MGPTADEKLEKHDVERKRSLKNGFPPPHTSRDPLLEVTPGV